MLGKTDIEIIHQSFCKSIMFLFVLELVPMHQDSVHSNVIIHILNPILASRCVEIFHLWLVAPASQLASPQKHIIWLVFSSNITTHYSGSFLFFSFEKNGPTDRKCQQKVNPVHNNWVCCLGCVR
jgi:hypothetical protein